MTIAAMALLIAYLIRFDFVGIEGDLLQKEWNQLKYAIPFYFIVRGLSFYFGKTYQGIIRYTSTQDTKRIFITVLIGTVLFALISPVRFYFFDGFYLLPRPVIVIEFLACLFLMLSSRFIVKLAYLESQKTGKEAKKIIIYGAGELGHIVKTALDRESKTKYKIVAFIDDDLSKKGKRLEGIPIVDYSSLDGLLAKNKIDQLIIGILKPDFNNKERVVDKCLEQNVETLSVPPVQSWMNGKLNSAQIRKVRIEDLLGRNEIQLSKDKLTRELAGKTVLVTGAAGSIGSEIARQLVQFDIGKLVLLDQAESALYDLMNEDDLANKPIEVVIADVSNRNRISNVFKAFAPDLVYHAAAYKHVPLMEDNPSEALLTNIGGSAVVADLSSEFEVEKFVLVSTDKAVNPTNVMGASKRIAEIYCQSLDKISSTKFITTRFGNVLGSNGSVIPLFRKQIQKGGPLTVTHKEITRYFMTITEACQLVLEAGCKGNGGEIFVFDMGESIKIYDLATRMIRLSGLKEGRDIDIKITGLRPGEKLYEELLNNAENTIPTDHDKILIGKVREYDYSMVSDKINSLLDKFAEQNNIDIVKDMKELVPEFKSNNSKYSVLDSKDNE